MKTHLIILLVVAVNLFYTNTSLQAQIPPRNLEMPTGTGISKNDTIHVVGHAHMDMNWLWTYFETMKMSNDNLRQTVAFMEEFPDYAMIQSQAAVFNFVERVDPPLFELVKKYVDQGRLELVGGMWTEGDTNLSSGEALARSFLFGQKYFQKHFGKTSTIGWLPDNFGHTSQLPQMLQLAGMNSYYFHRCKPYLGTFWWEGPDGSTVLCYANDTYNGNITPKLQNELNKFDTNKHRIFHITGVGDHGGGPTRENINLVHELDQIPDYPAVKFSTASDFFRKASMEMEGKPTHFGEMQFIFEGCYTTVSEIKSGNRDSENSLYSNEFFNTLRWLNGDKYPQTEINNLWKTVVFNQFHDILPGSAIYEANRDAVAGYNETIKKSKELTNEAFLKMADEVNFQEGMGQPVVAYNLYPNKRSTIVEAMVYSHEEPVSAKVATWGANYYGKNFTPVNKDKELTEGNTSDNFLDPNYDAGLSSSGESLATVLVRDASGKEFPAQIVYSKSTPPGYTTKVQFIDNEFPAGGYKTYYVDVTKKGNFSNTLVTGENSFETDFFTIQFNPKTGGITSLFDKRADFEYVKPGSELNNLRMYLEDKKGGMKSWTINKIVKEEEVENIESVKVIEKGPVRACIETIKTWGNSRFIERTYIYKSYPRIEYDMEVHWLETGSDSTDSPMLRAHFPLNYEDPRFYNQVAFNVVERPVDGKINGKDAPSWLTSQSNTYGVEPEFDNGQEVPAQKWVDVTDGKNGIALLNKTKYGHSYHNGDLRLTLMRSAGQPDIYPNLGKFNISYALYPHSGDWKNGVWIEGDDFNIPIVAYEPPSLSLVKTHATRPEADSFFSLEGDGVYMTGIKKAEDSDDLIVRLVEVEGNNEQVSFSLPNNIERVRKLNFLEEEMSEDFDAKIFGNKTTFTINPHEIVTLGLKLK
ncbi:MAG: glycoside hydrolase family 38 C-terminal domain-containing protein [Fermentimonas sp.]|nr:glycoside hydrolase family 38 C-terminal domain-containing protein [Fermentimonas sp.]